MSEVLPPNVWFFPDARADLGRLDRSQRVLVLRAVVKIARAPDQVGKPLGHLAGLNLAGFRSVYVDRKRIRIVWKVAETGVVQIAVIAAVAERDGLVVYRTAAQRREAIDAWILKRIESSSNPRRQSH
ncbi:hypothetical protein E1B22_01100 [Thermaerobacter sp. FW80]|uniref:type II toxin-antitoxin system RelE family toxin n=1 Tax=Thermaerobacter sp. FW80 TaxID=2546351 RepID=UPI00107533F8|nr:hypothetical protein [Thermaerobacter sp. FW80]QBS36699.1 hypothetical protein E1B22_01100 [Thermaerobacter sp. FW80]